MAQRVVGVEDAFEVIRRDLEDVVKEELERLDSTFGFSCRRARVWEDQFYFEFNVEYEFGDLPAIRSFYARKSKVEVISARVEVILRDGVAFHIATINFYFVNGRCYKDYVIHTARINDLAQAIIQVSEAEVNE